MVDTTSKPVKETHTCASKYSKEIVQKDKPPAKGEDVLINNTASVSNHGPSLSVNLKSIFHRLVRPTSVTCRQKLSFVEVTRLISSHECKI